ncbi:hypothetical protein ABBQ38_011769 [Trebouxia sp. C0009 RCD-2024]
MPTVASNLHILAAEKSQAIQCWIGSADHGQMYSSMVLRHAGCHGSLHDCSKHDATVVLTCSTCLVSHSSEGPWALVPQSGLDTALLKSSLYVDLLDERCYQVTKIMD